MTRSGSFARCCRCARLISVLNSAFNTARQTLHTEQHELLFSLIKLREAREPVLDYVANILDLNVARLRMNPDRVTTSSDGFLLNLFSCLLQLCSPFLNDPKKVHSTALQTVCFLPP